MHGISPPPPPLPPLLHVSSSLPSPPLLLFSFSSWAPTLVTFRLYLQRCRNPVCTFESLSFLFESSNCLFYRWKRLLFLNARWQLLVTMGGVSCIEQPLQFRGDEDDFFTPSNWEGLEDLTKKEVTNFDHLVEVALAHDTRLPNHKEQWPWGESYQRTQRTAWLHDVSVSRSWQSRRVTWRHEASPIEWLA